MKTLFAIFAFTIITAGIMAQDAKEIIKKMDDKFQGNSNKSVMEMAIVRPKYTRTIEFKNWSLDRNYFMTYITAPAKDKGQVFMKFKTEMWSFNPGINRMIKLPPSMMSQGWMGSDYTNDDLVKQSSIVNDYDHSIVGEETIEGYSCYVIEMVPHHDANVVWGKVKVHVAKDIFINVKSEYYDEEQYLVRTEIGRAVKNFDGRELPSVIEIIPADEPENKTLITIKEMDFDVDLKQSFFTQQNMKRIR